MAFAFTYPLPTPYEDELLGIFREECAEASIRASKLQRFGALEREPGQDWNNIVRLSHEIGDLQACIDKLYERGLVDWVAIEDARQRKIEKLPNWMKHKPDDAKSLLASEADWKQVCNEEPRPHRKYIVRREDVILTATPCYGMHDPWWVPLLISGHEAEPVAMLDADWWKPRD